MMPVYVFVSNGANTDGVKANALIVLESLRLPERLVLDLYTQYFLYSSQYGTRDA
jgi:hypothetical protein